MNKPLILLTLVVVMFISMSTVHAVLSIDYLSVSDLYEKEAHCNSCGGLKTEEIPMTYSDSSICFLERVGLEDLDDDDEDVGCYIVDKNSKWYLQATAEDDTDAWCSARCVSWNINDIFKVKQKEVRKTNGADYNEIIPCGNDISCSIENSVCGLGTVELSEIDSDKDKNTWCNINIDGEGMWVLNIETQSDADAKCNAMCLYWGDGDPEIIDQFQFDSSVHESVEDIDEKLLTRIEGNVFCMLDRVRMWEIDDKGQQSFCIVRQSAPNWVLTAIGHRNIFSYSRAFCEGRCFRWNPVNLPYFSSDCGDGAHEPLYEECDDGDLNGPEGECSIDCKINYCDWNVRVGECSEYEGTKCIDTNTNPEITELSLIPKCDDCDCLPDEECSYVPITDDFIDYVNSEENWESYPNYIPFETSFDEDQVNELQELEKDGAVGTHGAQQGPRNTPSWGYEIIKGSSDDGTLLYYHTFPIVAGDYQAEAYIRTEKDESIRIYGVSGNDPEGTQLDPSVFAQTGTAFRKLTYDFSVSATGQHTFVIEVDKRGSYYVDDIMLRKKDGFCEKACRITEAHFLPTNNVDLGDEITVGVKYSGACPDEFNLQLDAWNENEDCVLEHENTRGLDPYGWIEGIDISCNEDNTIDHGSFSECIDEWITPHIPRNCEGEEVVAKYAAIYNGDIMPSNWITQITLTRALGGYLSFDDDPTPEDCGNDIVQPELGEECEPDRLTPFPCSELSNPNLIQNPSFEIDSGIDYDPDWTREDKIGGNELPDGWVTPQTNYIATIDDSTSYEGDYSVEVYRDIRVATQAFSAQDIPVELGKTYLVSGYVKTDCDNDACYGSIVIECADADHGGFFEECDIGLDENEWTRIDNEAWQFVSYEITVENSDTAFARILCYNTPVPKQTGIGTVWCDSIHVTEVTEEYPEYEYGTVYCTEHCRYNIDDCSGGECDNGFIERSNDEECDCGGDTCTLEELNDESCETLDMGYTGGTLACYPHGHDDECTFDMGQCDREPVCDDGFIDGDEQCDGDEFGPEGDSCDRVDNGYGLTGTLTCSDQCLLDVSSCDPGCNGPGHYGDGRCDFPLETIDSCPNDCLVILTNPSAVASTSEFGQNNIRFTSDVTVAEDNDVFIVDYIVCSGASSVTSCKAAADGFNCGIDYDTGNPKPCICKTNFGGKDINCDALCFDVESEFYIYSEGQVLGITQYPEFKSRSENAPFSCIPVGLDRLVELRDLMDRNSRVAAGDWHYYTEMGNSAAAQESWDNHLLFEGYARAADSLLERIYIGAGFTEQEITALIDSMLEILRDISGE
ncbi:hypothetical protein ACFLQN_02500 [Candidatus Aenigmatarchaeota archaeon]